MNPLTKFFTSVLVVLLIVLGGLWLWLRSATREAPAPATEARSPARAAPPSPPPVSPGARESLDAALALKNQKKFVEARDALRQWLAEQPDSPLAPDAEQALGEINVQLLFTPLPAPEKVDYTIQAGDSLDRIARKFHTTVELLQKSHRLASTVIRPGDRLRIYQARFSVVVDKTANTLTLLDDGKLFKKYRCGTGEFSMTPIGDFKIVDRIPNPAWWKDGKVIPYGDTNNVLGTHWLKLDVPGYGIHGTWEPDSIGKQSSAGCVRLLNEDVAELFALLPNGTPVNIHD
jgi:lipoprotein-anchoring transpeptidase ErfK/SrfK